MSIVEQSVVDQEIVIPPSLPVILKQFCKAAIRTQPYDLLKWSSSYFRALADGEEPPVKLRLEYPPPSTASGLTFGFLRVLLHQFGDYNKSLPVETILRRWDCLCLDRRDLNLIMMIGKFRRKCQVKKFLAIAVGLLGSSLFETMIMICELFTHEPEGGSAMVPVTLFMEIYGYLAGLRCDGSERDSSDEDPTEFIICDSVSSASRQSRCSEEKSLDRVCSVTSQDTEADVNLDLELVSRDDADSSRTDVNFIESYTGDKDDENKSSGGDVPDKEAVKTKKSNESSATEAESSKKSESSEEKKSNKNENGSAKSTTSCSTTEEHTTKNQSVRSTEDKSSNERRRKKKMVDPKLIKYYPNIPGIGPRLSAEEVASVAIWMSECARVQEGLVGPRNLRHMNCPPLDRQPISES
ncbi:uncharacterized protein LOC100880059 isoform X2 [Megachile rotundata]|uniref:uncharacterized protein LOC100880059 isoform X2 n=1 Tax=Megachile rotundata TaxID=143995 RepID=UPI000258F8F6|nr:PREDICTED: uncharacterized protein LOC100880059 isoform X2 [Megachile rotundata]